jgi:molybdate transport system permease protein
VGVVVQLPLAVPPLICGILLVYIVGPYTFLGQLSGERLTQTMYGVVIAQSFVSLPFLVVVARSAFRAVDPSLGDVAATLGHGPLARFLRVDVPAASEGLRTGAILMWLRAFGEYGTTVVLAYHPYSLPVYVDNLFSSGPLSLAEAPTILAFGVAVLAIAAVRVRRPARVRRRLIPAPLAPVPTPLAPVGFDIDVTVGTFRLRVAHPEGAHRLAVVGPSGSGKSVTLRVLAGLLGPDAGTVTYGDVDVSRTAPERRRVGYVPQGFGLMPGRTVWQQAVFGVDADPARAAWWLQTLHLDGLLDRLPEQLSGGQRQRVSLARALAGDPRVVLLDEPFSALDAPVRAELRRELRRLQREVNLSTVLVTHDPEEAAMLADEIMVVSDGQVLQLPRRVPAPRFGQDRSPARHRQPLRGRGRCRRRAAHRPGPRPRRPRWRCSGRPCYGSAGRRSAAVAGAARSRSGPAGTVAVGRQRADRRPRPRAGDRHHRPRPHRGGGGVVVLRYRAPSPDPRGARPQRRRRLPGGDRPEGRVGLVGVSSYWHSR